MLNLPALPQTRIARQLTCVCCNHVFTIAEDDPLRYASRSSEWRFPPDAHHDTQLRYQPDRSRRPVATEMRAESNLSPNAFLNWNKNRRDHVNCPRCGADNRNWMHIINQPSGNHILRFEQWRQRFGIALVGLLITVVLVIMAAFSHYDPTPGKAGPSTTFLIVIALAGIVPTIVMLSAWPKLRVYKAQKVVFPTKTFLDFSPPLRAWFAYTALFLIILPLFLYVAIPSAFHIFSALIKPEEELPPTALGNRVNNVGSGLEDILVQAPPENAEMVEETLISLEKSIDSPDVAVAAPAGKEDEDDLLPWISVDKNFLNVWFKYVLAASIAALVFSSVAVNRFVRRISLQLPRPIFHSLANMTRMVVWEAGSSLEVGDEIHLIQWTRVQRNEKGGIDLAGLYRDAVSTDLADDSPTARVRAQRYEISADMWGRIESANVTAVRVPVRPRPPRLRDEREIENIEGEFFRTAVQTRDAQS